jgi:putative hydrolase
MKYWPIEVLLGVELTHLPPEAIAEAARSARAAGAQIVAVHGETMVEPVPAGTNLAALRCPEVNILAHPGLLSDEEAVLASTRDVFVEISARRGHSLSNGRVAQLCLAAGARLIVDSDGHGPDDLLTEAMARLVALGAGVPEAYLQSILVEHPQYLLAQVRR